MCWATASAGVVRTHPPAADLIVTTSWTAGHACSVLLSLTLPLLCMVAAAGLARRLPQLHTLRLALCQTGAAGADPATLLIDLARLPASVCHVDLRTASGADYRLCLPTHHRLASLALAGPRLAVDPGALLQAAEQVTLQAPRLVFLLSGAALWPAGGGRSLAHALAAAVAAQVSSSQVGEQQQLQQQRRGPPQQRTEWMRIVGPHSAEVCHARSGSSAGVAEYQPWGPGPGPDDAHPVCTLSQLAAGLQAAAQGTRGGGGTAVHVVLIRGRAPQLLQEPSLLQKAGMWALGLGGLLVQSQLARLALQTLDRVLRRRSLCH